MSTSNLFDDIPAGLPEDLPEALREEITRTLLMAEGMRIERIVSTGQSSPEGFWYDQDEHEWVVLLSGSAGLEVEGESSIRKLAPGDFMLLPAHRKHRVAWTDADEPTIWLAVFFRSEPNRVKINPTEPNRTELN